MNILIVGGGFGGVKAALELARRGVGRVTLISDQKYFLHHGMLYSTAVGRDPKEAAIPLSEIFKPCPGVKLVHDSISKIDAEKQEVQGVKKPYKYDQLVMALGVTDYFYGVNGGKQYSFSARTLEGVQAFNSAFHDGIVSDEPREFTCAVIGGGMTGVEMAGALSEYAKRIAEAHGVTKLRYKTILLEKKRQLLPGLSESASRKVTAKLKKLGVKVQTGKEIERISKTHLTIDGKRQPIDIAIWTCGGQNNPLFAKHKDIFRLSGRGQVVVNQYLSAYPNFFVIGDSAETAQSRSASNALADAIFIAKHLKRLEKGRALRPRKTKASVPMLSIPISRFWAYCEWGGVYVAGFLGSLIRRTAELSSYCHFLPLEKSYNLWRKYRTNADTCKLCRKST